MGLKGADKINVKTTFIHNSEELWVSFRSKLKEKVKKGIHPFDLLIYNSLSLIFLN